MTDHTDCEICKRIYEATNGWLSPVFIHSFLDHSNAPTVDQLKRLSEEFQAAKVAAKALRAIPSDKRSQASRDNGKKGGRPKKIKTVSQSRKKGEVGHV